MTILYFKYNITNTNYELCAFIERVYNVVFIVYRHVMRNDGRTLLIFLTRVELFFYFFIKKNLINRIYLI